MFNRHMIAQAEQYKQEVFFKPAPEVHFPDPVAILDSIPEDARSAGGRDSVSSELSFLEILNADRDSQHHWSNLPIPRGLESELDTIVLFVRTALLAVQLYGQDEFPGLTVEKMPILAYEEHRPRKKMARAIARARRLRSTFLPRRASTISSTPSDGTRVGKYDTSLIEAYLKCEGLRPLHCRRTLDQYCYYMLENTEARDRDQVVYKWARKQAERQSDKRKTLGTQNDDFVGGWAESQSALNDMNGSLENTRLANTIFKPKNRPVIMVDQLWLWVLPDGLLFMFCNPVQLLEKRGIPQLTRYATFL